MSTSGRLNRSVIASISRAAARAIGIGRSPAGLPLQPDIVEAVKRGALERDRLRFRCTRQQAEGLRDWLYTTAEALPRVDKASAGLLAHAASDVAAAITATDAAGPNPSPLDGAFVFVIADDDQMRDLYLQALERAGASVAAFTSAVRAVANARTIPPDVVVMDGDMSGRESVEFAALPIIAIVQPGTDIPVEADFVAVLFRPVELKVLCVEVGKQIARWTRAGSPPPPHGAPTVPTTKSLAVRRKALLALAARLSRESESLQRMAREAREEAKQLEKGIRGSGSQAKAALTPLTTAPGGSMVAAALAAHP